MRKYIGSLSFYKKVIMIALPIMAQQFITTFVSLIDNVMIGSVGDVALTAVTVANKFFNIYNSVLFGICGACGIFIAQYFGANDKDKCQKVFNINLFWGLLVGILFFGVLLIVPQITIEVFTSSKNIVSTSLPYVHVSRFTFLPFAITMTCMMALRTVGITKTQLKIGSMAVIINTILNYCLIFGNFGFPALGVQGAAVATLVARIIEMSMYLYVVIGQRHFFKLDVLGVIKPNFELMKHIIPKAIPLVSNEIFYAVGLSMIYMSYIRLNEYLVAAISVVDTISNIMYIIFGGLSSAVAIMIGTKLGANKLEDAKDNANKLIVFAVLISVVIGIVVFIMAPFVPMLYNLPQDINNTIIACLHVKSFSIIFVAVNVTIFFILRAGGDAFSTLLMDSGFLWLGGVCISTILSILTDIPLIYMFAIVELLDGVKTIVALYFYKKERWVKNITVKN